MPNRARADQPSRAQVASVLFFKKNRVEFY